MTFTFCVYLWNKVYFNILAQWFTPQTYTTIKKEKYIFERKNIYIYSPRTH